MKKESEFPFAQARRITPEEVNAAKNAVKNNLPLTLILMSLTQLIQKVIKLYQSNLPLKLLPGQSKKHKNKGLITKQLSTKHCCQ
jgi:hypothetical protein